MVAFVVQTARGAAFGIVADGALEGDHGAFRTGQQPGDHGARVDGMADQCEIVTVPADFGGGCGSTTHRRQKGHFVTFSKG